MRTIGRAILTMLVVAAAASWSASARSQSYVVEDLRIPAPGAGPEGLEALLVEPAGTERNPLALITNGSPRADVDRPKMTARQLYPQALEFARRGFTAVVVLRRGYGRSGGGWAEGYGPCRPDVDYISAGRAGAADLVASILALSARPDVDASRILAVGVSAGGFATVALTEDPPAGLVAAISFAGGRGSEASDMVCAPDRLVAAFSTYGRRSRLPMLWVYAANDHFFNPALADQLHQAFVAAGGTVTFVQPGPFGREGHSLFSAAAGAPIWTPIVDEFLAAHGLRLRESLLPAPQIPDVPPPADLSRTRLDAFQAYLAALPEKAFAVSSDGHVGWSTAKREAQDAVSDALQNCTSPRCRIVMRNDVPSP